MKLRDGEFIDLVNHGRIAELNDRDVTLLKSKFVDSNDDYPKVTLHIFAENTSPNIHKITLPESIGNKL